MTAHKFDYDKLKHLSDHLESKQSTHSSVSFSFQEVEEHIGVKLPPEANEKKWWYNKKNNKQAMHWLSVGYRVRNFNEISAKGLVYFTRKDNANETELQKSNSIRMTFTKKVGAATHPSGNLQTRIIPIGKFILYAIFGTVALIVGLFTISAFSRTDSNDNLELAAEVAELGARVSGLEYFREMHQEMVLADDFYLDIGDAISKSDASLMLTVLAEEGYASAQFTLGLFYLYGESFLYGEDLDSLTFFRDGQHYPLVVDIERVQCFELAEEWLTRAAQHNYVYSRYKYDLALIYLHGLLGYRDYEQAEQWLRKAALQNHTDAMTHLSYLYINGLGGLQRSLENALYWIRKSAELENSTGQINLAIFYYLGTVVDKCYETAVHWFTLSANAGSVEAQIWLASMNLQGLIEQYNKYYGYELLRYLAESDNYEAQHNMGILYHRGIHVNQCYYTAVDWFRKSADQNFVKSYFMLGYSYQNSLGVPFEDRVRATRWFVQMQEEVDSYEYNLAHIAISSITDNVIVEYAYEEGLFPELVFTLLSLETYILELEMSNMFHQEFAQIIRLFLDSVPLFEYLDITLEDILNVGILEFMRHYLYFLGFPDDILP